MIPYRDDQPDYVRTWRGQRYLNFRCSSCGRNFYVEEPPEGIDEALLSDDRIIDDEGALNAAEEELRRQTKEDGDNRLQI